MKRILMAEYVEYNCDFKLGNHHYAEMFAKSGYEVLWLSPVYSNITKLMDKELYKHRKDLDRREFKKIGENIFGYSPYSLVLYGKLPLLDTKLANKMSIKLTIPNLKKSLKKNNFYDVDVLWLTNPKYYYLTEIIKYKKLVYRCADDVSGFKKMCRTIPYFEEKVIKKADEVFVTALSLLEKKKYLRNDLIYLPNGVELDNFIRDKYVVPEEFKNSSRKKCIYVGAIDHWFDIELVKKCAENLKDVDFYFIGPVKIDLSPLKIYKNISILGKRDYEDVPDYLYYSDVSIIPFEVSTLTDSVTPIKLYEYMSVGLNVVSTNFKEMSYINSPAYVAENEREFLSYVRQAIESKEESRERNIRFAKENTWAKRFDIIKKYVGKD